MVAGANSSTPLTTTLLQQHTSLVNKGSGWNIPGRVKINITCCKSTVYNTSKEMYPLAGWFLSPYPLTSTIFYP